MFLSAVPVCLEFRQKFHELLVLDRHGFLDLLATNQGLFLKHDNVLQFLYLNSYVVVTLPVGRPGRLRPMLEQVHKLQRLASQSSIMATSFRASFQRVWRRH